MGRFILPNFRLQAFPLTFERVHFRLPQTRVQFCIPAIRNCVSANWNFCACAFVIRYCRSFLIMGCQTVW